jgi:hypothetical protein
MKTEWKKIAFRTIRADVLGYTVTIERYDIGARMRVRMPYLAEDERGRQYITKALADVGYKSVDAAKKNALQLVTEVLRRPGVVQSKLFPNP